MAKESLQLGVYSLAVRFPGLFYLFIALLLLFFFWGVVVDLPVDLQRTIQGAAAAGQAAGEADDRGHRGRADRYVSVW